MSDSKGVKNDYLDDLIAKLAQEDEARKVPSTGAFVQVRAIAGHAFFFQSVPLGLLESIFKHPPSGAAAK